MNDPVITNLNGNTFTIVRDAEWGDFVTIERNVMAYLAEQELNLQAGETVLTPRFDTSVRIPIGLAPGEHWYIHTDVTADTPFVSVGTRPDVALLPKGEEVKDSTLLV